jgi:formylglycine-generating enzyme required for sulfatase activity
MRRWFLSYHSPDQALAERLKVAIERKDSASRVFFAPTHMRAGGSWSAQLAQEIAEANAFILLVGEKGVGGWQVLEYDEALDKRIKSPDFPLIVVLLEGHNAPGLPFLRRLHWIVTPDPTSEKDVARLFDAASGSGTNPGQLWRYTCPYRGLEAMTETDSDYFFGRMRETVEVLNALAAPDRLPVLIGNSGVGKSSLAQAGVLAALKRQAWPEQAGANEWPGVFKESRQWCFLSLRPGTDPLKALVESFLNVWGYQATDPQRLDHQKGWIERLRDRKATVSDLIDATEGRRNELGRPKPPAFFLYVDQGEELYVRAEQTQASRFSELLAQALPDQRLRTMMSMRADFLGSLHADKPLFKARQQIDIPPLGEEELHEVVSRPAQLLGARFETERLAEIISRRAAEDSVKDVGALPLLSYTLDDMWSRMVRQGDGTLRLPAESFELGGVLVERANAFLAAHPRSEAALRRILTLRCATVHKDSEPTRRRAAREEFSDEEWRLVSELADHPNRLLATSTIDSGETYAEVAHEAVFRRWDKLREWIAAEREFLIWRTGLEAARRAWRDTPDALKPDALLMGAALSQAESWLAKRAEALSSRDREFIVLSIERERKVRGRARRVQALFYLLVVGIIGSLLFVLNESAIKAEWRWFATERPFITANISPYVLNPAAERALKPGDSFRECASDQAKDYCPEMIVVPAGSFMMGSPPTEKGRYDSEGPQHSITIAKPIAVAKVELTFDELDTCVAYGDCAPAATDNGWGRGQRPAIIVTSDDVERYLAWLSRITGKLYRLLSEAEYEYAARAGTQTAYPWGDDIGKNNANCVGCGSQWDNRQTAPVGSFAPNKFGLYDMVGNVWELVEDCAHDNYKDAPVDGSAWIEGGDCRRRIGRGGPWSNAPRDLRSASRYINATNARPGHLGFRVGRTLIAP